MSWLKEYWGPMLALLAVLVLVLLIPLYVAIFIWSDGPCYGC